VGTGKDPCIAEVGVGAMADPTYETLIVLVPSEGGARFVSIIGQPTE
jgi:hypothetical protein